MLQRRGLLASQSLVCVLTGRGAPQVWEAGGLQLWQGEPSRRVGREPRKALRHRPVVHTLPGARRAGEGPR